MALKRYLLFAGMQYYPEGGWSDFKGAFDSPEDARSFLDDDWDWFEIVDRTTGERVSAPPKDERKADTLPLKTIWIKIVPKSDPNAPGEWTEVEAVEGVDPYRLSPRPDHFVVIWRRGKPSPTITNGEPL